MLKISLCQLLIEGGEPNRNFDRIKKQVEIASSNNSNLIIFPECSDFGWTHPSIFEEAATIPGKYSSIVSDLCKKYKIDICIGLTEKYEDVYFNSAIYVNDEGIILNKYRKINILSQAKPFYKSGSCLQVFQTRYGAFALTICSDNYLKSSILSHSLSRMGAQLIISPCSWTVDHDNLDQDPYGQKWSETMENITKTYNNSFLAVTSVGYIVGGPFEGRKMIGCSLGYSKGHKLIEMDNFEISTQSKEVTLTLDQNNKYGTEISENVNIKI